MSPSYAVYVFSVWCSASALIFSSNGDSVNLRSSVTVGVAQGAGGEADSPQYYLLQRVGFQSTGPAQQPRSPHTEGADCLTVGGPDRVGVNGDTDSQLASGFALGWMPCQDLTTVESAAQVDAALREQQLFVLKSDGTLMDKKGRCVRRVPCNEGKVKRGYVYDLFSCEETTGTYVVKVKAEKAQANSVLHLREMGWLRNAVEMDSCQLCGPYRLLNNCVSNLCGESYQAHPGWTKLASSYVGDEAASGRSTYGVEGDSDMGADYAKEQVMGIDMSGVGYTKNPSGMCGSWVTDSPAIESYFYLLKDDSQTVTPDGTI